MSPRDELDRGREQDQRLRWQIAAEIQHPGGQVEWDQVTEVAYVRVPLREIEEPDLPSAQQFAHGRRGGGIARQKRGVDLACQQRLRRDLAAEIPEPRGPLRLDAVRLEEGQGEEARATAFGPDRDTPTFQLGQPADRRWGPIEDEDGLVEHTAERDETTGVHEFGESALDEPDVHRELWVREPLQILERPLGWQNLERDTVAHEDLTVLLGGGLANAAIGTTRDNDGVGRRGTDEVDGDPDRNHTHDEDRAQRRREIAPRNALDALGKTQRADLAGAALLRHQHSPRRAPRVRPAGSTAEPS